MRRWRGCTTRTSSFLKKAEELGQLRIIDPNGIHQGGCSRRSDFKHTINWFETTLACAIYPDLRGQRDPTHPDLRHARRRGSLGALVAGSIMLGRSFRLPRDLPKPLLATGTRSTSTPLNFTPGQSTEGAGGQISGLDGL